MSLSSLEKTIGSIVSLADRYFVTFPEGADGKPEVIAADSIEDAVGKMGTRLGCDPTAAVAKTVEAEVALPETNRESAAVTGAHTRTASILGKDKDPALPLSRSARYMVSLIEELEDKINKSGKHDRYDIAFTLRTLQRKHHMSPNQIRFTLHTFRQYGVKCEQVRLRTLVYIKTNETKAQLLDMDQRDFRFIKECLTKYQYEAWLKAHPEHASSVGPWKDPKTAAGGR